jgi:putative ABC transport system substrate-binding protein
VQPPQALLDLRPVQPDGARPALIVLNSQSFHTYRTRLVELAAKHRLPTMYHQAEFVVGAGGLMSYGADFHDLFRRSAIYVDRILKGTKPGDLPIEQPTKFELVINMKTAKARSASPSRRRCCCGRIK